MLTLGLSAFAYAASLLGKKKAEREGGVADANAIFNQTYAATQAQMAADEQKAKLKKYAPWVIAAIVVLVAIIIIKRK